MRTGIRGLRGAKGVKYSAYSPMTTKEDLAYTYTEAGNAIARAMLAYVTIRLVVFGEHHLLKLALVAFG